MPYDILVCQSADANSFNIFQKLCRLTKAGLLISGKVDLRQITCDDRFGTKSKTRQEHLHLRLCRILRLVQHDKCIIQRSAAHIRKRCDLDRALLHVVLE